MLLRNISVILSMFIMIAAFTNCCTTKNELKEEGVKNIIHNAERPPSPGNAEIKCAVLEVYEKGNKSFCKIKVTSVLKYGSGTRPIGNGSIIDFECKTETKTQLLSLIENEEDVKLLISEVPGGMGMEHSSTYRLITIIK